MSDLRLTITNAGYSELTNRDGDGTAAVRLSAVALGSGSAPVDRDTAALENEVRRIDTLSGEVVDDHTLHVFIQDESRAAYTVHEFALVTHTGVLFGVYSQADVIIEKAADSTLLLAIDIALDDIDATRISFGDVSFLNPPASETVVGVVRLASQDEVNDGSGGDDVVTSEKLHRRTATTGRAGLVRMAATADTARGDSTALASTPAGVLAAIQQFGLGAQAVPTGNLNLLRQSGLYRAGADTIGVPTDSNGWLVLHIDMQDRNAAQMAVFTYSSGPVECRVRYKSAGDWSNWSRQWNDQNHGDGSGLDADSVDGVHLSQLLRSDTGNYEIPMGSTDANNWDGITFDDGADEFSFFIDQNKSVNPWLAVGKRYIRLMDAEVRSATDGTVRLIAATGNMLQLSASGNFDHYVNGGYVFRVNSSGRLDRADGGIAASLLDGPIKPEAYFGSVAGVGVTPNTSKDFGKSPSIAIGDDDSGIRSGGDGVLELWANNTNVAIVNRVCMALQGYLALRGKELRWEAANGAYQRADSRGSGNHSRLHWYGVTSEGATTEMKQAWYDGTTYINVTPTRGGVEFDGWLGASGLNLSDSLSDGEDLVNFYAHRTFSIARKGSTDSSASLALTSRVGGNGWSVYHNNDPIIDFGTGSTVVQHKALRIHGQVHSTDTVPLRFE